jgi:aspartyl-tRNA(Asn)/glutamyl-tRNA(Gln) amidotransferase subunit A
MMRSDEQLFKQDGGQMSDNLCDLTALQLSERFGSGTATPVDALEAVLERHARLNPRINAIVTLDPTGARRAAEQSAARWRGGTPLSPLDGVPITIKDNLIVAGLRATWGSRLYEQHVPQHDELPVERLRAAGLVFVGKTNVPEFTLQGYTDNLLFGPTRNPWNLALTPGGSSGGAVASVAAGIVPIAIGTDGGGSIRRPASHTGLVGLKPTMGRVARDGGFPAILHDMEVAGPITRDVADTSALMSILAGPDPRDPASLRWPRWSTDAAARFVPGRVLYVPAFGNAPVDPEIAASVALAAKALAALGCDVVQGEVPFDAEEAARAFGTIGASGLSWLLRDQRDRMSLVGPALQQMAEQGNGHSAADHVDALAATDRLKRALAAIFTKFDVVMTPAAAALPWPANQSHPASIAATPVGPRGHAVFTGFANIAGCPGLALPCAPASSGLPIGLQLVAAPGNDEGVIALANKYEAAQPWLERRPTFETT